MSENDKKSLVVEYAWLEKFGGIGLLQVVKQVEHGEEDVFEASNGVKICCENRPEINGDFFYIRGRRTEHDLDILVIKDFVQLSRIVDAVEELGNVNRIIFKDPGDYVIGSFYLDETNCYYIHWDSEEKENWAIPRYEKGLNESDLSTGDILVISPSEKDKYVQNGFEIAFENTDFVLLKKL